MELKVGLLSGSELVMTEEEAAGVATAAEDTGLASLLTGAADEVEGTELGVVLELGVGTGGWHLGGCR